jgi:putative addiction module killer protein
MKYQVSTTEAFDNWVRELKDRQAVLAIAKRIDRAIKGNLGDILPVGGGVSEMRIFIGPGYRLYFTQRGGELIILLCGGDKSAQQRDIQKALELAKNL